MKIKIEVTQDLIDTSTRKSLCLCPIARAVTTALYNKMKKRRMRCAIVTGWGELLIEVAKGERMTCLTLPRAAREFITLFDKGAPVEPFSFYIETGDLP